MTKLIALLFCFGSLIALHGCGFESCGAHCPNIGNGGVDGGSGSGGTRAGGEGGAAGNEAGAPFDGGGGENPEAGSAGDGGSPAGSGGVGGDAATSGTGGSSGTPATCDQCPASAPFCDADRCVECAEDAQCADGVCEEYACVQCRENSDCKQPLASRCTGASQCARCSTSAECSHIEGMNVCAGDGCVQCTGDKASACGSAGSGVHYVCDSLQFTCTTQLEHSAGLCESCVSDAQCKSGQLCVMQTYDDPEDSPDQGELDVGYFCVWREDSAEAGAPGGDCANARPYVATLSNATSIDGAKTTVCGLRVTTCAGYENYSAKACSGTDDDATCGDARFAIDGYCEQFSASTYRCTTPCLSDDDCDVGASCSSGPPKHCSL